MLNLKKNFFPLIALSLFLVGCAEKVTIGDLKSDSFVPKKNLFGQDYEITGYVLVDPVPLLVTDPYWIGINKPIPESEYILLTGNQASKISEQPADFEGKLVRLLGTRTTINIPGDSLSELAFESNSIDAITNAAPCCTNGGPTFVPLCDLNNSICQPNVDTQPRKYAILYSGGVNFPRAYRRYWNDLVFMYHVLRNKYGFKDENIIVVYKNGVVEPLATGHNMPVHFKATSVGINAAFSQLSAKIGNPTDPENDLVFIFTTNHGGQANDLINLDEASTDGLDEVLYYYNPPSSEPQELRDEDLDLLIDNNIPTGVKVVSLFGQCHSGGFLKDCAGENRINISASGESQDSYGLCTTSPCMRYDAFSYFFTSALYGQYHDGSPISSTDNLDRNNDSRVSILEAYWFARAKDQACCTHLAPTHLLDDDNNGQGTDMSPTTTGSRPGQGQEGDVAHSTFLDKL